jgi:hypothetical protein
VTKDLNTKASQRRNALIDDDLAMAEREHFCLSKADVGGQAFSYRLTDLHDKESVQIGNLGNCLRGANAM